MKKEDPRTKAASGEVADRAAPNPKAKPEHGAESQLHNYNVLLTRLGDLFALDDELEPTQSK